MSRKYNLIDDGYYPELVQHSFFAGCFEIPILSPPPQILIPKSLTPFSKRKYAGTFDTAICEYEHDIRFSQLVYDPSSLVREIRDFSAFITPDCSLYRDMPLCLQIANTYLNRAVGAFFQSEGIYVIPNVRWGDERSFTTCELPEKFAFLGVPRQSIVSVGTYGCIRGSENRYYFQAGLDAMLQELDPKVVLVYGQMPYDVFKGYLSYSHFVQYDDWTTRKRKAVR